MTSDAKVRFMIVDDHPSIRKLCMTVGASVGFSCVEAESAVAALAQLENSSPDIILADLMMPNMTGLEFLKLVRDYLKEHPAVQDFRLADESEGGDGATVVMFKV